MFFLCILYNKFDIIPLLFDTKHFNLGDKPMFKTRKKGIRAYWTAPNSYVPKSQNYETEIFMQFESLGVRPECLLSDLKTGRVDSFGALISDARDAMETAIYQKIYELLAQTYNATGSASGSQASVSNTLTKTVLDDAINKFNEACVLAKTCDEKLKNATDSINKILNEDGSLKEFTIEE